MKRIFYSLCTCLFVLIVFEVILRNNLFEHVSYSNSESIDRQLEERDKKSNWDILFVGDSETRWGVDPREIDKAFQQHGIKVNTFNHAFDGFGASWWASIIPNVLQAPSLSNVKVIIVGVQLTSKHRIITASDQPCGALQRPVLTSPYAMDIGIDDLCQARQDWDVRLARNLFHEAWVVKYSSAVRTLLLPDFMNVNSKNYLGFNSSKSGEPINGFVPHRSISEAPENYDDEFKRWKEQYNPEHHFVPLPDNVWPKLTKKSGFFDQLKKAVTKTGRVLVLYALPTNPVVIDTFNRRQDYLRNSELLKKWAEDREVIFIDLGIQDVVNSEEYFSDMRHLSGRGASLYSEKLGNSLAPRLSNFFE